MDVPPVEGIAAHLRKIRRRAARAGGLTGAIVGLVVVVLSLFIRRPGG